MVKTTVKSFALVVILAVFALGCATTGGTGVIALGVTKTFGGLSGGFWELSRPFSRKCQTNDVFLCGMKRPEIDSVRARVIDIARSGDARLSRRGTSTPG